VSATGKAIEDLSADALERLKQLLQRAEQGDEAVLPALGLALDAHPEIWQRYGDLGKQAEAAWVQMIAGPNLLLRESLTRKLEELRAELGGTSPSPLERLLVARVLACWLQVHYADTAYAQLRAASPAQHSAALKRQNAAQQRYLQAVRALATVRKLLRPALSPVDVAARMGGAGGGRWHHAGPEPAGAAAGN
jgi:hypothetical protein